VCHARAVPSALTPDTISVAFDATPLLVPLTGVGVFCFGALEGLARRDDLDVSAFAVSWRRRRGIEAKVPSGVSTGQRAMPARPLHRAWRRGRVPSVDLFIGRHDVVHGSNFVVPPTRRGVRVVTVHDLTVLRFPEMCTAATLEFPGLIRRAIAEGAWVHTPSHFVADEVRERFAIDPDRVRAIHHGMPASSPMLGVGDADQVPLVLPEGISRYLLAIGTIEPRKDYPLLLAAFDRIAKEHPDVALVIVGGDGWGVEDFARAFERSTSRDRVLRPGYLSDGALDQVLRGAAALAYPSRYEGFGFPPLQAMAAGVPVVTTSAGAIPEVVGDAALLSDPGDLDALVGNLSDVLSGGASISAMIHRGRERSRQFTWEASAAGLAELYRDAIAAGGSRPRASA